MGCVHKHTLYSTRVELIGRILCFQCPSPLAATATVYTAIRPITETSVNTMQERMKSGARWGGGGIGNKARFIVAWEPTEFMHGFLVFM